MEDPSLEKGTSPKIQRSEHKSDPRVLTREDLDNTPNQRQCGILSCLSFLDTHIDTDLDVAYSILFEEANNEYIKERENEERAKANGKSLIPQRVFQSFLDNVERDVSDYVISIVVILCSQQLWISLPDWDTKKLQQKRRSKSVEMTCCLYVFLGFVMCS